MKTAIKVILKRSCSENSGKFPFKLVEAGFNNVPGRARNFIKSELEELKESNYFQEQPALLLIRSWFYIFTHNSIIINFVFV